MIRLNLQDPKTLALNRAIASAVNQIRARSRSGRHPEEGRKINCPVCRMRHWSTRVCVPVYTKDENGIERIASQTTRKGVNGAAAYKGRILPHHNHLSLQLVQRTQQLYEQHAQYLTDPREIMYEARKQAIRQLKNERDIKAKNRRRMSQDSRRINAGLVRGGFRSPQAHLMDVSATVRNKRQDAQKKATEANKESQSGS